MPDEIYTVQQVTQALQKMIEETAPPLWVEGEVSDFRESRARHWYFSLKDAHAQLPIVVWKLNALRNLHAQPKDGDQIRVFGELGIYPQGGEYQLQGRQIHHVGQGSMNAALDRLKEELRREGLFSDKRKKPLPKHPAAVGVVTSPRGSVVQDILTVTFQRYPIARIAVYPVAVQGKNAPREIVHALQMLNRLDEVDVIILGRGGGAAEDLSAFNDEAAARAVAESRIPIISAVGHETDVSLTDLAADLRASTPSSAAEAAVPDKAALLQELIVSGERLSQAMLERLRSARQKVSELKRALSPARQRLQLRNRAQRVDELARRLEAAVRAALGAERSRLKSQVAALNALSPLAALERGYSVCFNAENEAMRDADTAQPGDPLRIRLHRGEIMAAVESVHTAESETADRENR